MAQRVGAEKDYYAILGVREDASGEEIKRAYRRLALQHHPDRNPGDRKAEERFKAITEAYGVLIDREKRRQYDQLRRAGRQRGYASGLGYTPEEVFRDLFRNQEAASLFRELGREFNRLGFRFDEPFFNRLFFGGRGVVFGVAFFGFPFTFSRFSRPGVETSVEAGREAPAFEGWRPGRGLKGLLGGIGALAKRLFGVEEAPSLAGAKGPDLYHELPLTREEAASGTAKRIAFRRGERLEEIVVKVPAGVRSGTRLRLKGKGLEDGKGGAGDLYLTVRVEP